MPLFFINSHRTEIPGPVDHLIRFLKSGGKREVVFVFHPLEISRTRESIVGIGTTIKTFRRERHWIGSYIIDIVISTWNVFRTKKIDFYIGMSSFDCLPALLCRKNIRNLVCYASDFSEQRFRNTLLNYLYKIIEKLVLRKAKLVVSNTKIAAKRREELGLSKQKSIVIPNGVWIKDVPPITHDYSNKIFIYIGHLTEEHGLLDFIKVFTHIPECGSAKFLVIGDGPLKEKISSHPRIRYCGRKTYAETLAFLARTGGIGVAPYRSDLSWTKYASPLKIKDYLACGMPVITTNATEIAIDIEKNKLGFVCHNEEDMERALTQIKHMNIRSHFAHSINNYVVAFDWNTLLENNLMGRLESI